MNKENEIMSILAEECAEVIQSISKCNRFGIDNLKPGKPKTNREHLEDELGDVLAMIDIMLEHDIIQRDKLDAAKYNKFEKLKKWSTIYEQN
jgi:NTP pyrophosphatase (non-canonical NTP hydrolase)